MSHRAPELSSHPLGKSPARFVVAFAVLGVVMGSVVVFVWRQFYVAETASSESPGASQAAGTQREMARRVNSAPATEPPDAPPRLLRGHRHPVGLMAPSSSGERLLSADSDGTVIVWDFFAGEPLAKFDTTGLGLRQAALSSNGKWVAACGKNPAIELWKTSSEERIRQFEGHTDIVSAVRFFPHQNEILSASFDRSLIVWNLETGELVRLFGTATHPNEVAPAGLEDLEKLDGHYTWIRDIAVLPEGRQAVSAGNDAVVFVWDLETGRLVNRLIGHRAPIMALILSTDGRFVASIGSENAVIVWDLASGTQLRRIAHEVDGRRSVAFTADSRHLAIAGADSIHFVDVGSGDVAARLETPGLSITSVAIATSPFSEGSEVVCGFSDGQIRIWPQPATD